MIAILLNDASFEQDIRELLMAFYPGETFTHKEEEAGEAELIVRGVRDGNSFSLDVAPVKKEAVHFALIYPDFSNRFETKNEIKQTLYRLLSAQTGRELPWGTLTGIRPTKIALTKLYDGWTDEQIETYMRETYFTSKEKIDLSIDVAERERRLLSTIDYENGYSLYVGIPFCPTTCLYCSFTSFPIVKWEKRMDLYKEALFKEMEYVAEQMKDRPLSTIYFGDLHFASSGYEWESIREQLSRSYTVYTLDLLGCGRSEKPNLTYTNYLFVQLICDFIKSEIGHRTNILSTGDSAALSIMACSNSPELFDQIMLINPSSLTDCCQLPGKNAKLYKLLLDLPLAGTLIYHIACSRSMIEEAFRTKYFYNPYTVKPVQIDRSHEAAHLGECPKAIFSSIECRYTKCNISNALRKIDNSIFIIGGSEEPMIEATIQDYKIYNSAIESSIIPKTKHLPQLEQPDAVMDAIHMFFS